MIAFMLKLLIAHFIGDFVLQPSKWVEEKNTKSFKSKFFYLHGLVHLTLLLLLLGFQLKYLAAIFVIVISHLFIDLLKLKFKSKIGEQISFVLDQLLHLLVIFIIVNYYYPFDFQAIEIESNALLFVLCLILLSSVSSIIIKVLMGKWSLLEDVNTDSLPSAGKTIGILERLFVFTFIVLGQWSAIGFLLAAKSVFRFSDLSRAKDRKLTEYILIGTLLSFGLAVLIGLAYLSLS